MIDQEVCLIKTPNLQKVMEVQPDLLAKEEKVRPNFNTSDAQQQVSPAQALAPTGSGADALSRNSD